MPAARKAAAAGGGAVVSKEHGFRVTLPSKPQEQKVTQQSPAGPIDVFAWVVAPQQDGLTYVVTATKLPGETAKEDPKNALGGVVNGTITSTKGTLASQKDIRLGSAQGREFDFSLPAGAGTPPQARSRAFVANGRIYQLLLMGSKDRIGGPAGTAFFDSFALTTP